ncbi:MAG: glycosyl hydrolase family 18 protein [bacterium]
MSKKTLISLISGAVVFGLILGLGIYAFTSAKSNTSQTISSSSDTNKVVTKEKENQFLVSGWIPDWGTKEGLETIKYNSDFLDSISPVWYEASPDGTLKNKEPKNKAEMMTLIRDKKLELIPSIASFDHEILTPILQTQANLDRHVSDILNLVKTNNYDGIDIDYESTKLSDKDKFFELLQKLSAGLKKDQKRLTVAVLPQWGESDYPSFKETRKVQDWTEIAKYADEIRIMTYDYTSGGSQYLGPIAPLDWQESVIKYGLIKTDKSKLSLGIHLYSYEKWIEVKDQTKNPGFDVPALKFETDFRKTGQSEITSRSYTFETVSKILKDYPGTKAEYQGEQLYRYSKPNNDTGILENRLMVYIDQKGVQARIDLAKKYGLKGVAFWRLGGEGELLKGLKV